MAPGAPGHSGHLACAVLRLFSIALAVAMATDAAAGSPGTADGSDTVEIRFLANEGVLLRNASAGVLIDAFVTRPFSIYGDLPQEVLVEMFAGGAPFHTVRLALVSHVHEDHFQAEAAALFLQRRPSVQLVSSEQVIAALRAYVGRAPKGTSVMAPRVGEVLSVESDGVRVEFLNIPHGSERHADIQSLVHIVHLAGRRILHLGDATMQAAAYEPYHKVLRDLDVAIIPYWFFLEEEGQATLETHLQAALQIAVHLPVRPKRDVDAIVQRISEAYPHVRVFDEPMEWLRH